MASFFTSVPGDLSNPGPKVGVVQMTSTCDKEETFYQASSLANRAAASGAQVVNRTTILL